MAATDPHNKTGVMVAKLFFDMSHLRVCAGSMPKFRPSLTLPESPGALH